MNTLPLFAAAALLSLNAGYAQAADVLTKEVCLKKNVLADDKACNQLLNLQVASPEWQDQIIYSVLVDRFFDGDATNNDQAKGEYGPKLRDRFNGGDINGIVQKLEYIQNLGATALWATPVVANMWWDPRVNYGGYHGYWARDFKSVDEHFGTLADYRLLSTSLHDRGMYLIQDVVVNHVGNFFSYVGGYDAKDPTRFFSLNTDAVPGFAPTQYPFNLNNVQNAEHRAAAIYHWTPEIGDFANREQETTFQSGMLNDINTENPVVREALKDSYNFWIKEAGVDGIRIDTVKYVEPGFYEDFLYGQNGLTKTAKALGKTHFFSFGEIYSTSSPYDVEGERKIRKYLHENSARRIDGPLGFPLYKDINRVFAGSSPTEYLAHRLKAQMEYYVNPHLAVNFIDSHDVDRFLSSGSVDGFKQAYAFMFTVPGLPTIYQGDEQGLNESRRALFAGGYKNDVDQFNPQSDLYRFIQALAKLRKSNLVFSRGDVTVLAANENGPGILAYTRQYNGKKVYVVFNSSDNSTLLNGLHTGFTSSEKVKHLFVHNIDNNIDTAADGTLTKLMPPRSILVFEAEASSLNKQTILSRDFITVNPADSNYHNQNSARFSGKVSLPGANLLGIVDGQVKNATKIHADANGNWVLDVPANKFGEHKRSLEIYWPEKNIASKAQTFNTNYNLVDRTIQVKGKVGDAKGLNGQYRLPLHPTIGCEMDLTQASAMISGQSMVLTLELCQVSALWEPPNHFDHVAFSIFFTKPNSEGVPALPLLQAALHDKSGWNFAHIAFGWGNYIYSSEGASAVAEGRKIGVAPHIVVDRSNKTIQFHYDGDLIGVKSWNGVKLYITTWDKGGEGGYRNLSNEPSMWTVGAPDTKGPLIMDALTLTL